MDYLIYGKIIIDDIKLATGEIARNILGGGGPQAAFGSRLWSDSIGFLSRSGTDIEATHVQTLQHLRIDLSGWHKYADIPTPRNHLMDYDDEGYMIDEKGQRRRVVMNTRDWLRLLAQVVTLPAGYQQPRLIHLITEFYDEPMIETAMALREKGVIFSLEPLIDFTTWSNKAGILALIEQADLVTPDWPSASGIAQSNNPKQVVQFWSRLGPKMVAIRRGHYGCYVWDANHDQIWHIPAVAVALVDPTGAGNSYGGGLCVGWSQTRDAKIAGCYGVISAKFLVERVGLPKITPALQQEAQALLEPTLQSARQL